MFGQTVHDLGNKVAIQEIEHLADKVLSLIE